jgi:NtrC-family two-component system sensor histidine kinase KinB
VEIAADLRHRFATPVVYLTAHSDNETVRRALLTEPFGYIVKPFEAHELHIAVEIALYRRAAEKKLKQAEQAITEEHSRLQALIRSNRSGIILVTTDWHTLVVNTAALELFGLPGQPEDWLGRPVEDWLRALRHQAPDVVKATLAEKRRIGRGDEPANEGEYEVAPRIIHWQNLPVLSGTTRLGRLIILRDVTRERRLEKTRDDLTRTMVHDLRNPLTVIMEALYLLTEPDLTEADRQQILKSSQNSAQWMLNLINRILSISRLESGQMPLEPDRAQLVALVSDMLELQAPLAEEKQLRLQNDVPKTLPPAWVDTDLIGRVLQNLIGNAIKFTPRQNIIQVTAELEKTTIPAHLVVAVQNPGPSIPPELQDRLFQKFVTGRHPEAGTGLGLAFCRLAVEAHGGRIWLESGTDHLTTFKFTLPIAEEFPAK